MTRLIPSLLTVLCAAMMAAAPVHAAAEVVVIVSAKSPLASLRPDQVADIFLGHLASLPDVGQVTALDQQVGSSQRDEFYIKVAAKTPPLIKAYWSKMIFTGRGQPPKEVPNSAAVRKMVADNPGLIGYVDRSALDASVKPVLVVR